MRFQKAVALAALVFAVLFLLRVGYGFIDHAAAPEGHRGGSIGLPYSDFEWKRANYASEKSLIKKSELVSGPAVLVAPGIGDFQKYERVARVVSASTAFDDNRSAIIASVSKAGGLVQYELSKGLPGYRTLELGIGVPPDRFDAFVDEVKLIGRLSAFEIAKNDKTSEYLALRTKRSVLDRKRADLQALDIQKASIEERLQVLRQLGEVDAALQEMGASLGEFDTQNEFCTVKLTLREVPVVQPQSMVNFLVHLLYHAFAWTIYAYLGLAIGLFLLSSALWIGERAILGLLSIGKNARAPSD